MAKYKADPVGEKICAIIGINPKVVKSIDIHIGAGEVLTAKIMFYPTEEVVEYLLTAITGGYTEEGEDGKSNQ
jgi:hypothetical protein